MTPFKPGRLSSLPVALGLLICGSAGAQEFPDVQTMANRVLFAAQDAARDRRVAEQRRVDELAARAERQEAQLQAQATSVQQLGDELRLIRDERQLIDLADAFDAAIVARRWSLARSVLADILTIDLGGQPEAEPTILSADDFVARLTTGAMGSGMLPRSNQHAQIDGDRAVLASNGYAWSDAGSLRAGRVVHPGQYEYRFKRSPTGWKINGLIFRLTPG